MAKHKVKLPISYKNCIDEAGVIANIGIGEKREYDEEVSVILSARTGNDLVDYGRYLEKIKKSKSNAKN